ncbi:septum formation family protein [Actinokineospora globicatena]|uniref:Septum formation-related domain-containing protein n=1 Tax=Actinokineospora globicatena TaxID=103729 RepID=A0A9W6V6U5_9PSEU|nr:septum formation family protein [Actinokineospora globicatena]GLW77238.1 hypothetical protein Aglo01_17200 [Actinokineospora globicatena]GLW84072.1 hypothetical protein Aglo02_17120 [Actinokineospora globicatena]GLW91985.1 hypothetical protein Aglo03_28010 [Actinokineospora globicatena]
MSGSGGWFRSNDSTAKTRVMMGGAFAGSLLLLTTSMVFSWPVGAGGAGLTVAEEADLAFDSPAGSCLTWTPPDGTDMARVDCAKPHLFEVTSNVDISAEYPESAPPPDQARWQQIAEQKCTPSATSYLGGKLDPFGRYRINALKPVDAKWLDGDRKVRCGLQRTAPSGSLIPVTGSAARQDQSNVHDPGTCLALEGQKIGDPIACDKAHAYEIVGNVDLGTAFQGEFPQETVQRERAIELCATVTAEYTGGADLAAKGLTPYPDTLQQESWDAGSRKVDCKVGAKLPDGSGLAPVTNSVRGVVQSTTSAPPTTTTGG